MKTPYIVGLTGPTGAGKTTAAAAFCKSGFLPIEADRSARAVTLPGSPALTPLAARFGQDILTSAGELDRKLLARRAFANDEGRNDLGRILFPFITRQVREEIARAALEYNYILLDAPTLFESGCDAICDTTVGVLSGSGQRKNRIIARDGLSAEDADTRLDAGKPDSFYLERCRFIIYNNGELDAFLREIRQTIDKILTESGIA